MVTPSACQRLQLEQSSATESCSFAHHTSTSTGTSCSSFFQLSPAKLWLLAALLLFTVAASWPTGTSAAPRVARGAHLLWPHPKTSTEAPAPPTKPSPLPTLPTARPHRRHIRRQARRHHHVVREAGKDSVLLMPQVKGLKSCAAMEHKPYDSAELGKALRTAQSYKDTVICLTEDWLDHFFNGTNILTEAGLFALHQLNLQHPLQDQVKKVQLTAEGKFEYEGPVGTLGEEMPKIIETLLVLETLVKTTKYDKNHLECTFVYIKDAIQSNIASAMGLMTEYQCNAQKEVHHDTPIRLPFFIAVETIKVLTILEHTYAKLISQAQ